MRISLNYASILVVDDDELIVHFFKLILEETGYDVSTAFTGTEAIEKASSQNIDLAILDYKLTDTTGDKLAVKLKDKHDNTGFVFVTGYSEARDIILNKKLSNHVVVKPIKDEVLIETVELALHKPETGMEGMYK